MKYPYDGLNVTYGTCNTENFDIFNVMLLCVTFVKHMICTINGEVFYLRPISQTVEQNRLNVDRSCSKIY
jgi:hypothetical protein